MSNCQIVPSERLKSTVSCVVTEDLNVFYGLSPIKLFPAFMCSGPVIMSFRIFRLVVLTPLLNMVCSGCIIYTIMTDPEILILIIYS